MAEDSRTTRRDTLKLAAAITAFGAALGFRGGPAGAADEKREIKIERVQHKFDRVEMKVYDASKLLHTCALPGQVRMELKSGRKLDFKWYRDGVEVVNPLK